MKSWHISFLSLTCTPWRILEYDRAVANFTVIKCLMNSWDIIRHWTEQLLGKVSVCRLIVSPKNPLRSSIY